MPDTGPTSERLEALRERWESDKGSRVFLQLADEYRRLGRAEDAVRVLEEGLAENPRYPAAQVALGRCQLELGRVSAATATLEQVIESDPTQMVAYRLLVDAYVAQGKPEEARQRLRVYGLLNDADPDIAELRRQIGLLERQEPAADPARAQESAPVPAGEAPAGGEPGAGVAALESAPEEPEPVEPFDALEAPALAVSRDPGAEPFPELGAPRAGSGQAATGDDLFGLAPPAPSVPAAGIEEAPPLAAEPAARAGGSEPFELEPAAPPPAPDLSSLLDREAEIPAGEAAPEAASPAGSLDADVPVPEEAPTRPPLPTEEAFELAPEDGAEENEEPVAEPLSASVAEAGRPTVTLGLLYLRQGHTREAEEIFRAVLDRDPDNAEALRHLEEIGDQLRAELGEPRRLTAADLLQGWEGDPREVGTTRRKRYVLERYGDRIRGRARGDVH